MEFVLSLTKICKMKKIIRLLKENYAHRIFQIWLKDFDKIFGSITIDIKNIKDFKYEKKLLVTFVL